MVGGRDEKKDEKKKVSPFTLLAGAAASVSAMLLGSLLGDSGTLWGAAAGSVVSGACAVWYENAARYAHARMRAEKEQDKADTEPGHYLQQRLEELPLGREALIRARQKRILYRSGWDWGKRIALGAGAVMACLGVAVLTLISVEAATGKTLHSDLGGPAQYGTTLGGYSTQLPPSPKPGPSPQPSSQSPSATATAPSVTPSASPSVSVSLSASPSADAGPDIAPSPQQDPSP